MGRESGGRERRGRWGKERGEREREGREVGREEGRKIDFKAVLLFMWSVLASSSSAFLLVCVLKAINQFQKANFCLCCEHLRFFFCIFRAFLLERLRHAGQTIIPVEVCPVSDKTKTNLFFVYPPLPLTELPLEMCIFIPPLLSMPSLFVLFCN